MSAAVLAELTRVKALFQLRAIYAAIGIPADRKINQDQPADSDTSFNGRVSKAGSVVNIHIRSNASRSEAK